MNVTEENSPLPSAHADDEEIERYAVLLDTLGVAYRTPYLREDHGTDRGWAHDLVEDNALPILSEMAPYARFC